MEILFIPIFVVCVFAVMAVQRRRERKQLDAYIRRSFGTPRKDSGSCLDRLDRIDRLYRTEQSTLPESEDSVCNTDRPDSKGTAGNTKKLNTKKLKRSERSEEDCIDRIDEVTWNDLNMDGVFALVNHTDSFAGEQVLYSRMHRVSVSDQAAAQMEEQIRFFDENEAERGGVRRLLCGMGKSYIGYHIPETVLDVETLRMPNRRFFPWMSAVLVVLGLSSLITREPILIFLLVCDYLCNMIVHLLTKGSFENRVLTVFKLGRTIQAAHEIAVAVPQLGGAISEELRRIERAARLSRYIERRKALEGGDTFSLFFAYLFGPLLIDFILYDRILTEISGRRDDCLRVYRFVGELDAAIAIASWRRSLGVFCVPRLNEDKRLEFRGLVHPLISDAVPNDFCFEKNVIVTGSNASGKSTFIKAVAVNLILGQTIHTCAAAEAAVPECGVFTSMAIRDDIDAGESYYIREVRYLKRMVDRCEEGKPVFLAIDEILRGTNTRERIAASKAMIRYFCGKNCMLMVATHDLELALAFDGECDNLSFQERLDTEDVVFDYVLRRGICMSGNAVRLLGVLGFPDEIILDARMQLGEQRVSLEKADYSALDQVCAFTATRS